MEYNTSKSKLILPEYGRNIQNMVNIAKGLPTKEERSAAAREIISIMGNLNPHLRDINDFKHKLWDHLTVMANFELDIDAPYPQPTEESLSEPPKRVDYTTGRIRYRHYGKIVEKLIAKAAELPEGKEREVLVSIIANHMKKSYVLWNKDIVSDDIIVNAIEELSEGRVQLKNGQKLTDSKEIMQRSKPRNKPRVMSGHKGHDNNRRRNNNNGGRS